MSLLNLLSLDDEQIEVVTDVVRLWCEENSHDINSTAGRSAMEAAVQIASSQLVNRLSLSQLLAEKMASRADLQ